MSTTANIQNGTRWVRTASVSGGAISQQVAYQSTLNVEIGELRFRFFCETGGQCIWLEDFASDVFLSDAEVLENLRLLVFDHQVLSLTGWKKINVLVSSDAFTLVPELLFRKEYTSRYLQLTLGHPVLGTNKALFQPLPAFGCYNVFQMPSAWREFFQDQYALQDITISHVTSALIAGSSHRNGEQHGPRIHIHVQEGFFFIVVSEREKLMLCNRYRFQNPEEATFFVLSCLNKLDYLPEGVQVTLSGETTPFSGLFAELSRFIPHIRFAKRPAHLRYPEAFYDLADHRYFALLHAGNV